MYKRSKVLAWFLAIAVVISMMPAYAFAEATEETTPQAGEPVATQDEGTAEETEAVPAE